MITLLLLLGCQPPNAPATKPAAPKSTTAVPESSVLGVLLTNEPRSQTHPSEYVLEDGHLYRGAPYRIGHLNVMTDGAHPDKDGKVVLAQGQKAPSLFAAMTDLGPVPPNYENGAGMFQVRSDWVPPEGGYLTTRKAVEAVPVFHAKSIQTVDVFHATVGEETTEVVITNPMDVAWSGLEARAHYEGGPGKPMARYTPLTLDIPPNGQQKTSVPNSIQHPVGTEGHMVSFRLQSIDIAGTIESTEVDLVLSLPTGPFKRKHNATP